MAGFCEPLGLLSVGAVLEEHGIEVAVIDGAAEGIGQEKLESRISEFNPDVIGVAYMMTELYPDSTEAVKTAKRAAPEAKIVVGGHYASFVGDKIIETSPEVDYVVVGEGENTFLELVRSIENKRSVDGIKGITFRHDGKAVFTGPREPIQNLDELPLPARHLVANIRYGKLRYEGGYQLFNKIQSGLFSSRGCPFGCTFCSCTAFSGRKVRVKSPEKVVDEMEYVVNERGVEQIFIVDDNFTMFPKRVMEICRLIKERNIEVDLVCEGRVDTASKEMYENMADAGCRFLFFGLESGSQKILDYYEKKTTVEKGEKAVELAQKAGLDVIGSFVIGAPIETEEDFQKTLDLATRSELDVIEMNLLKVLPGTELWRRFEASGAVGPEDWNKYLLISDICDAHSKEELEEWAKRANKEFYIRPTYLMKEIWRTLKRRRDMIIPALRNLL
jgi:radical SAM superfamily enzyme YgiQ (UPF0313 family)